MNRTPSQPVKDPPNLVGPGTFSLERLLSHVDPGTAEESETFIRYIYDQRRNDRFTEHNGDELELVSLTSS